jgi:hypothetical protein
VTGTYEFILETSNGTKLWVNDRQVPIIDAWVASSNMTQHRATVRLLGGRVVPLQLDMYRHKEKSASLRLQWIPPYGAEELIPSRVLLPTTVAPTLVVRTPFPADDRSAGYVQAHRVSKAWDEATTYTALEVAARIVDRLPQYLGQAAKGMDRIDLLRQFCTTFAQRAFRQPLSAHQLEIYVNRSFRNTQDLERAVKKNLLLVLTSPHFLYRETGIYATDSEETMDSYERAAWLAFALWDSLPDDLLRTAAANGQLRQLRK